MRSIISSLIVAILLVVVISGCDNNPTQPEPDTPSGPTTAAAAVDSFGASLARLDSTQLKNLLSADFELLTGRSSSELQNDLLTHEQTIRGLANLCARVQPGSSCLVDTVSLHLEQSGEWETVPEGSPFAGSLSCRYLMQLNVLGTECYFHTSFGYVFFYVEPIPGNFNSQDHPHQIVGIEDYTQPKNKMASLSFSKLMVNFLYAGLPAARLVQDFEEGTTETVFSLDATNSSCGGYGLVDEPFRWLIDDGQWSDWQSSANMDVGFSQPGEHSVELEVRNTVGWVSRNAAQFSVVDTDPSSLDELLRTFAYAHEHQDPALLLKCVSPQFRFVLMPEDIAAHGWPSDNLDFPTWLTCMINLFSDAATPDMVTSLSFDWSRVLFGANEQKGKIDDSLTVKIDLRVFMRTYTLSGNQKIVSGPIIAYASPYEISMDDGTTRQTWWFDHIFDSSYEDGTYSSGDISWGELLLLYH